MPRQPNPLAGLLFGLANQDLAKRHLHQLVAVERSASSLLTSKSKGRAVKRGGTMVGPIMLVTAQHMDGHPMQLQLQAISKESQSNRVVVKLSFHHPYKGHPDLVKQLLGEIPPPASLKSGARTFNTQPSMAAHKLNTQPSMAASRAQPPGLHRAQSVGLQRAASSGLVLPALQDQGSGEESSSEEGAELNPGNLNRVASGKSEGARIDEWISAADADDTAAAAAGAGFSGAGLLSAVEEDRQSQGSLEDGLLAAVDDKVLSSSTFVVPMDVQ